MKTLTVVLVVAVYIIHISGYLIHVPTVPTFEPQEIVPVKWLHVQKLIIPLFENVCEVSNNPVIRRLSQEFTLNSDDYLKPEVIANLQSLMSAGLLPKEQIFSEYNAAHMKELKIIYEVLYYAKDFDTFYRTAAWARQQLNCGLYINAIYMTIQNRKDTERLSIPAPYELLPNYFVHKDAIIKAASILAGQEIITSDSVRIEGNAYYIDANYTGMFYDNSEESKLAYFREDVGLNSYYFLRKLRLAPWFNGDINAKYGEMMYQMMKQFNARYNLERYANGLPELDDIDWNTIIDIPYDPKLIYTDGYEFSHRTTPLQLSASEEVALLQTIENNIVAVVSHMRQGGYSKTQILNHIMEILVTGDRSYETLARQLLGRDLTNNGHVSVMEHYMTSLRDPIFWKINKKIVDLVDSSLKMLPSYSRNELYFPGVEVANIDVKKMMTAYDYFVFDVTDALKIEGSNSTFNVKIGQPRLNHKPFTIKVNISSIVSKKGLVKIYLGPKLLPGELATKKNLFTLLDMFEVNLKIGTNIVSRTSDDMKHFSVDFMSLKTISKKVEDAEFGLDSLPLTMIESQIGYPSRLILPKGSSQGLPIQIFVFVAPYSKASLSDSYYTNSMEFNSAILSPGYPLDLTIEDRQLFTLPNAMVKYFTITQKGESKIENYGGPGVTKQWYGSSSYDPSSRPNYSAGSRKSFDYSAKRGITENTITSTPKINEYNVGSRELVFDDETTPIVDEYYLAPQKIALDDENVDLVTSTPHLLKLAKSDYSSKLKRKESFEHKKKVQFDQTEYPKVMPLQEDISRSEDDQSVNLLDKSKSSKYDYTTKHKKFDYKSKKSEIDAKIHSMKKQNVSTHEDDSKYLSVIPLETNITPDEYDVPSQTDNVFFNKKKDMERDESYNKYTVIPAPEDDTISETKNQDSTQFNVPRLLKATKYDYSSKYQRKEPFDYKSKKAEFDRKYYAAKRGDYSAKRGDYSKYRTAKPKEDEEATIASTITTTEPTEDLARVVLNKDVTNVDLVREIAENNLNFEEDKDIKNSDEIKRSHLIEIQPIPIPDKIQKRAPTVYDFLFHTIDYEDSSELKVYE